MMRQRFDRLAAWLGGVLDADERRLRPAVDNGWAQFLLVDIEAKRNLIALAAAAYDRIGQTAPQELARTMAGASAAGLHDAVRAVAMAYHDRRGFDEAMGS